jgi:hypothetical protein
VSLKFAQGTLTKVENSTTRRGKGLGISNWKKVSIERIEMSFASSTKMDFYEPQK